MRRRAALAFFAGAVFARPSAAQLSKIPTVGVLFGGSTALLSKVGLPILLSGMAEFGYRSGDNVVIEVRAAEGRYEQLPAMAAELVAHKADVIVALASPASLAAKEATSTIPIVVGIGADPIALGLVNNLHRPDGNIK